MLVNVTGVAVAQVLSATTTPVFGLAEVTAYPVGTVSATL